MTATIDRSALEARWERAMENARRERLKAERVNDRIYAVRSTSRPGSKHLVIFGAGGRIERCTECEGWRHYAEALAAGILRTPCKHAGAAARRKLRERPAGRKDA